MINKVSKWSSRGTDKTIKAEYESLRREDMKRVMFSKTEYKIPDCFELDVRHQKVKLSQI